jgi:hypothetical protein
LASIVFLIEQIAPALYIFLVLTVLYYVRVWQHSRHALSTTTFELERHLSQKQTGKALMAIVLLFEAGLMVFGFQSVVAPTIRDDREQIGIIEDFQRGREDGDFRTPTPQPASGDLRIPIDRDYDIGAQQNIIIRLTPVPTNTPVGTIEPADDPMGCDTPYAILTIPANGMKVFQTIRVEGVAYHENFSSFKIELSGPSTLNQFVVLDEGTIPLAEVGTLSQFNPAGYEPGDYFFRLMVFDTTTAMQAFCEITIYITEPIPTPTPFF